MVECPHALVQRIAEEDFRDPQEGTIKQMCSFPAHILSSGETNATTIRSVHSNQITRKMDFLHQAQANQMAHAIALPFKKRVSTSVRMHFATATMIVWKETDYDDPHHLLSVLGFVRITMCCEFRSLYA